MRFYLNRQFVESEGVGVINDLRLEDEKRPKPGGAPDVCQIDHLVIHRWGMFIVESKSIHGTITVRPDGAGGDEWTRTSGKRGPEGMDSPIAQGERQGELLRRVLQDSRAELLGKMSAGLGTISKLVGKTDQRGFAHMPNQVIAAISGSGIVERGDGWEPSGESFRHFLCKADQVTQKIVNEYERHRAASKLLGAGDGNYGLWSMHAEEVERVVRFLEERNRSPRTKAGPEAPTAAPGHEAGSTRPHSLREHAGCPASR